MQIIENLDSYFSSEPLALSLGMFDGVHLGHQSIINNLIQKAEQKNLRPALLTFWPHPRLVFNPNDELKLLNTLEEKLDLIKLLGVEYVFLQEFNEEFRSLSGEDFVRDILVNKLNVQHLIIGYDHVFGKNRSGNFQLLEKLAPELGFEVEKMEAVNVHENNVSSTKIRIALEEGAIEEATVMLGYPYRVRGEVVHGRKLGRTLGYPTANLKIDPIKQLPSNGAYIVSVWVEDNEFMGMASIGTNPTVNEGKQLSVEVNILDFEYDIYGKTIEIQFHEFLHPEIKFSSLEELIDKLKQDEKETRKFFS